MTNHLRAIDIKEYAKALDVAKEFADRAEKAEAAIARVRDVCDRELIDAPLKMMSPVRLGYRDALRNIIRALEGDSDEPAGP